MTEGQGSPAQGTFRVTVQSRSLMWILGFILPAMFAFVPLTLLVPLLEPAWGPWPVFAAIGGFLALIAGVFVEAMSRVTVGTDGVLIRRRLGRQYIAFADIADVTEVDGVALRFFLRDGSCVDLYTGKDEQVSKPRYVKACDELLARIRTALERYRERSGAGQIPSGGGLRERAHRSLRGEVRAERVPYRELPAPSQAELARVLDEGAAPPSARAAAAVLLRKQGDADARGRLRVAAETTADPALGRLFRVAAAHDSEDAAVDEAFAAVEQAIRSRRATE